MGTRYISCCLSATICYLADNKHFVLYYYTNLLVLPDPSNLSISTSASKFDTVGFFLKQLMEKLLIKPTLLLKQHKTG